MARSLTLTALLIAMFVTAACGGGGLEESDRAISSEPQQTQVESTPESVSEETAQEEPAAERAPAEDEAAESTQEDAESSGLTATTIEGEEVELGAQGNVTALFFMAGW